MSDKNLKISVNGNFFRIEGDIKIFEELYLRQQCAWCDALDFTNIEYYYYNRDGYTSFLEIVGDILHTKFGYQIEVEWNDNLSPKDFEANINVNYRPLQEEAIDAVVDGRFGMLEAPPGFGKTICIASMVAKIGKRALILTEDTKPYLDMIKSLETVTDIPEIGKLAGDDEKLEDVTVCLIQKVASMVKKKSKKFLEYLSTIKVIIVDECHHAVASSYADIIAEIFDTTEYRIGVSATPLLREDGTQNRILGLLGPVLYTVTYAQAIDLGICTPCTFMYEVFNYDTEFKKSGKSLTNYNSIVKACITNNDARNELYAKRAKEFIQKGISCAIIVDKHNHAYALQKLIPNSKVVLGPDPKSPEEREELWRQLQNQEIMCVISTLLDEAANIPSLGAVLIASNQKTQIRTIQRMRSTRVFEGETAQGFVKKERGYVYTTIDMAPYLDEHSKRKVSILKDYLSGHEANEVIEVVG